MTMMKIYIKEDNVMRVNKSKFKLKLNKMVETQKKIQKEGWKVQDGHGYITCAQMMIMNLLL